MSEVCKFFTNHRAIILRAFIFPFRQDHKYSKEVIWEDNFIEVNIATPLEVFVKRDVKGLNEKAINVNIKNFSSFSQPFEEPQTAKIKINTDEKYLNF